jgi:hypothetical protein
MQGRDADLLAVIADQGRRIAELEQIVSTRLGPQTPGAWTSYTPTLTSSGTQPSLGAGSAVGSWARIGPRTVIARFTVTFGAGMSAGSGFYVIAAPVVAASHSSFMPIGTFVGYDGVSSVYPGTIDVASTSLVMRPHAAAGTYEALSTVTSSVPFTPVATTFFVGQVTYETAT